MTKVAVIGAGAMGRHHLRVYRELEGTRLVGVADADADAAHRLGELHGVACYTDHCELLDRERPDAVSVAVPTSAHFPVVMDALAAGCHVLVEKPIASTVDEGRQMIEAAARAGRTLTVGHIERFNPAIVELRRRLDAGGLGRPYQMHARRLGPFPHRIRDVGVVVDLATHDLDLMCWLGASEPIRLYAEISREIHTTNEDLLTGLVRFANDAVGLLEINWLTPTKIRELTVTGERGMFRADYLTQDLYFFENAVSEDGAWEAMSLLRGGVHEGSMTRYALRRREPLAAELDAFLAAARGEREPAVSGQDGVRALALALALIESAQAGAPVPVVAR
ncbi:MAG TPA: Gfo/Idh/MocA family oxidoreductase [Candidatus Dormibacteraeota bacterium]|nr:Gfo/Idh/MocA family oxidoreductase [Candidatus Dormibacteraeota bacterium]